MVDNQSAWASISDLIVGLLLGLLGAVGTLLGIVWNTKPTREEVNKAIANAISASESRQNQISELKFARLEEKIDEVGDNVRELLRFHRQGTE